MVNKRKSHKLKVWPEYFKKIAVGKKTFELRYNDRDYKVGDILELEEWNPKTEKYTGYGVTAVISYLLDDKNEFGKKALQPGYVILGLQKIIYENGNINI